MYERICCLDSYAENASNQTHHRVCPRRWIIFEAHDTAFSIDRICSLRKRSRAVSRSISASVSGGSLAPSGVIAHWRCARSTQSLQSAACASSEILSAQGRAIEATPDRDDPLPLLQDQFLAIREPKPIKNQLIAADGFDRPLLLNNRDACLYDLSERLKRKSTRGGHNYETYNPVTPACNYSNMLRSIEYRYTRRSGTQRIELH
jgi:hypothetical protein